MPHHNLVAATLIVSALALGACSTHTTHGPGGVAYDTQSMPPTAAGSTMSGAGGSVSGGAEPVQKEQRGNTPPGMDRDGHGPAAGAIIDPTGAATSRKPY
jgi:predicted small secreted protein